MGVEVHVDTERGTGLIGIIHGAKSGKAIALRADIDALPVQEHNTFDFKSDVDGKMHACGHDGHMAILLGAAKMLTSMKDRIEGDVYLAFQPAEETGAGAPDFMKFDNWFEKSMLSLVVTYGLIYQQVLFPLKKVHAWRLAVKLQSV